MMEQLIKLSVSKMLPYYLPGQSFMVCFLYIWRYLLMLNMVKGCTVPFPDRLYKGYELQENRIFANINVEKILDVFNHFIVMHDDEPGFFILELPVGND